MGAASVGDSDVNGLVFAGSDSNRTIDCIFAIAEYVLTIALLVTFENGEPGLEQDYNGTNDEKVCELQEDTSVALRSLG